MVNVFTHVAKHKVGYIAATIAMILGVNAWAYNRIPDFDALKLAGATGRAQATTLRVISPNGGEVFTAGGTMPIQWNLEQSSGSSRRAPSPTVDIYLRTAGPNSGIVSDRTVVVPRRNTIEVARNVRGNSFTYTIRPDLVGNWKVVVLNERLSLMDESDRMMRIVQPAPLPDLVVDSLRFENSADGHLMAYPVLKNSGLGSFTGTHTIGLNFLDTAGQPLQQIGGGLIGDRGRRELSPIAPGATLAVDPFSWEACDPSIMDANGDLLIQRLQVASDVTNEVTEFDETNNTRVFDTPSDVQMTYRSTCAPAIAGSLSFTQTSPATGLIHNWEMQDLLSFSVSAENRPVTVDNLVFSLNSVSSFPLPFSRFDTSRLFEINGLGVETEIGFDHVDGNEFWFSGLTVEPGTSNTRNFVLRIYPLGHGAVQNNDAVTVQLNSDGVRLGTEDRDTVTLNGLPLGATFTARDAVAIISGTNPDNPLLVNGVQNLFSFNVLAQNQAFNTDSSFVFVLHTTGEFTYSDVRLFEISESGGETAMESRLANYSMGEFWFGGPVFEPNGPSPRNFVLRATIDGADSTADTLRIDLTRLGFHEVADAGTVRVQSDLGPVTFVGPAPAIAGALNFTNGPAEGVLTDGYQTLLEFNVNAVGEDIDITYLRFNVDFLGVSVNRYALVSVDSSGTENVIASQESQDTGGDESTRRGPFRPDPSRDLNHPIFYGHYVVAADSVVTLRLKGNVVGSSLGDTLTTTLANDGVSHNGVTSLSSTLPVSGLPISRTLAF